MKSRYVGVFFMCLTGLILSSSLHAGETVDAKKLTYMEQEQGIGPYRVTYTVTGKFIRINDHSDDSGYIVYDRKNNKVYSISHFDKSILVIPEYPVKAFDPPFKLEIEYKAMEGAPEISGKKVYNYRVKAVTSLTSETCMDIQLVPGLMPEVAESLQAFQKIVSAQHVRNLDSTPEEFRTPCYLVDQVHNRGDYYSKGLPIQEWHSNEKQRQLTNFEDVKVDVSLFDIPADYRQYSLSDSLE